jgi:hypothetical protein
VRFLLVCILFLGSFAHADRRVARPASVVGRVVGIEIMGESVIVTVAAGKDQGITLRGHARFREGKTTKLLAGGEVMIIRVDRATTVVKTSLPAAQVRANRFVQFDP